MSRHWDEAMRAIAAGEDVQQACDRASIQQTEDVRRLLREEGREDLVVELNANLRDVRLGLTHARAVWHSISAAQRRIILLLSLGNRRMLVPTPASKTRYGFIGGGMDAVRDVCGRLTVRALHARSLIEPASSNVFHYVLTEHGRFVIKHGSPSHEDACPCDRAGGDAGCGHGARRRCSLALSRTRSRSCTGPQ